MSDVKSTPEMRARLRELASQDGDDFDRAVIAVLDDFAAAYERGRKDERYEIAATLSAAKFFELATIVRARSTDHAKEASDV